MPSPLLETACARVAGDTHANGSAIKLKSPSREQHLYPDFVRLWDSQSRIRTNCLSS